MGDASQVVEGFTMLHLLLTGSGSAVVVAAGNAWWNRKSRSADPAKTIVAGSVEWANAVHSDNEKLRDRFEKLERRFDDQQEILRVHHKWDLMAAKKIRELDPDANFPDPPALEAA